MISILREDVPEYLRSSPHFCNSFQDGQDDELAIDIPADCLKAHSNVQSADDLRALLHTVRYWLVPELIEDNSSLFAFACSEVRQVTQIAHEYSHDFPFLSKLTTALQPKGQFTMMGSAVQLGLLGLIKHLVSQGVSWDTGSGVHFSTIAARRGLLDCLKYATEHGCQPTLEASIAAATEGQFSCLKYAHEHGAPIDLKVLEAAVRAGHVSCVQYILDQDTLGGFVASNNSANAAAAFDRVDCLMLLHARGCPISAETSLTAVLWGSLQCLEFLYSIGCGWQPNTIAMHRSSRTARARGVYYETISPHNLVRTFMYAVEHGCPVTTTSMILAVSLDSVEFVSCLHSRGVELDALAFRSALYRDRVACVKYFLEHGYTAVPGNYLKAVRSGSLQCLQCLHEHGVQWDARVASLAVQLDKPIILQYLLQHGCPVADNLNLQAAKMRHTACLKLLLEHGFPFTAAVCRACQVITIESLQYALSQGVAHTEDDCVQAATQGNLTCLQVLHEHGVPMTAAVVTAAAEEGHVSCIYYALKHASTDLGPVACSAAATRRGFRLLQQLREQGLSWDASTCLSAIRSNSFECLKYSVKNGCPYDDCTLLAEAALHGRRDMLKWLHKKGIAWDARTTAAAVQNDSVECLKYAIHKHCPYEVPADVIDNAPRCQLYMTQRGHKLINMREQKALKVAVTEL